MPSLRQLEYLVAIAETLHFRRAAEMLGVSQPTLSAQLSTLEERLGVQLVERSRSRVMLTPVGMDICKTARRIGRGVQEIRDIAAGQRGLLAGTVRLGLPPTIGPYLLPRLVPQLHKIYPDLKLHVREEVPQTLPASLEEGRHDVVIMPIPIRSSELHSLPLFREPLFLVAPASSSLTRHEKIERKDLRGQSILTLETGHQLREQVDAICEEFGAHLLSNFEGTSLDTLRQMVGMEMGLSFLPGLYVKTALNNDKSVKAMELKGRALYRTIGIVWRNSSARQAEFKGLVDHIKNAVKRGFPVFQVL